MIQRIQTLYFFIAFLCIGMSLLGMDIISLQSANYDIHATAFTVTQNGKLVGSTTLWIFFLVPAMFILLTIFMFKDRKKQQQVAGLSFILCLALIAYILLNSQLAGNNEQMPKDTVISYGWTNFVMLAAPVFLLLGIRGIKKDQKLIDSVDRIR